MKSNSTLKITYLKLLFGNKVPVRPEALISLLLLFIISIAYFYWIGNNIFFYQEKKSLFIFSYDYLQKFIIKPGGLLEYAGNFFTQFYYNPLYGSLVLSSIFLLLAFVFIQINKLLSNERSYSIFLILFPSCLLILLQKRNDHLMHFNIGYLLVAFWFLFSILLEVRRLGFIVFVLFPVFYYLAGSFALIYLGIYVIYGVFIKQVLKGFSFQFLLSLLQLFHSISLKKSCFCNRSTVF